jgi:hypothetical protein
VKTTQDRASTFGSHPGHEKKPRIDSNVNLSALLSSKPEKTWDCELNHLFSSFALIRL